MWGPVAQGLLGRGHRLQGFGLLQDGLARFGLRVHDVRVVDYVHDARFPRFPRSRGDPSVGARVPVDGRLAPRQRYAVHRDRLGGGRAREPLHVSPHQ